MIYVVIMPVRCELFKAKSTGDILLKFDVGDFD
jgi:hypothetical protein